MSPIAWLMNNIAKWSKWHVTCSNINRSLIIVVSPWQEIMESCGAVNLYVDYRRPHSKRWQEQYSRLACTNKYIYLLIHTYILNVSLSMLFSTHVSKKNSIDQVSVSPPTNACPTRLRYWLRQLPFKTLNLIINALCKLISLSVS